MCLINLNDARVTKLQVTSRVWCVPWELQEKERLVILNPSPSILSFLPRMPSEAQEPRDSGPTPPVTRAGRSAQLAKAAATSPAPERRSRGRPRKDGSGGRSVPPTPPPPPPPSPPPPPPSKSRKK